MTTRTSRKPCDTSVIDLIQQIKTGDLDASLLGHTDRRRCVRWLTVEGLAVEEIAQVLAVSERTIRRDRAKLRDEVALDPDPRLALRLAGWMFDECEIAVQRLRRVTRDPHCSPGDKIDAEQRCLSMIDRLIGRLQSMGLLASATAKLHAEISVPDGEELDLDGLASELSRLRAIESTEGGEGVD
ncbi:MAG: DeoR family transcriptional regulator [Planctomycetota bacterium]